MRGASERPSTDRSAAIFEREVMVTLIGAAKDIVTSHDADARTAEVARIFLQDWFERKMPPEAEADDASL